MRWIYLVYPALVLIMCFGAKFAGFRKSQWNEEFLSLKQTKAVQGFLAILILMHHVSQKVSAEWIPQRVQKPGLEIFVEAGYLFVALFFFYSGYGLFKSYRTKENYFEGFFIKRVLPIIVIYYLSNCIFLISRILVGERPDIISLILYILGLRPANSNSWYCFTIVILYIAFSLIFKLLCNDKPAKTCNDRNIEICNDKTTKIYNDRNTKICNDKPAKKENTAILFITLVVIIYQLICCFAGHGSLIFQGEWWFNSVQLFPVGLIFAKYEEKIIGNFKKCFWVYLPLSMILSVLTSELMMSAKNTFSYYGENNPRNTFTQIIEFRLICLVAQIIATLAVLWFVLLVTMKIEFGNRVLTFMSKITLEFYLIHALFIEIFCYTFYDIKEVFYIREPILFLLAVAIPSIPCALILKKLGNLIMKLFNNSKKAPKEA